MQGHPQRFRDHGDHRSQVLSQHLACNDEVVAPQLPNQEAGSERAAFLREELSSLLGLRAHAVHSAHARLTAFLGMVSAALIAVALLAGTDGSPSQYLPGSAGILAGVAVVGLATVASLVQLQVSTVVYLRGANLIRGQLARENDVPPRLLVLPTNDSRPTMHGAGHDGRLVSILITFPNLAALLTSLVGAAAVALLTSDWGAWRGPLIGVMFLVLEALQLGLQLWLYADAEKRYRRGRADSA